MKWHIFIVCLLTSCAADATEVAPWPAPNKQAAIYSCRQTIATLAYNDLLKRRNLEEQSPEIRDQFIAKMVEPGGEMEPYMSACNCGFDEVEKQWSFEYWGSHLAELQTPINEIMEKRGPR